MIRIKLDVLKISKEHLYKGAKGTYLDVTLIESKNSKFGDDFIAVQDLGAEARKRGEKGPILGNAKFIASKAQQQAAPVRQVQPETRTTTIVNDEEVPF